MKYYFLVLGTIAVSQYFPTRITKGKKTLCPFQVLYTRTIRISEK